MLETASYWANLKAQTKSYDLKLAAGKALPVSGPTGAVNWNGLTPLATIVPDAWAWQEWHDEDHFVQVVGSELGGVAKPASNWVLPRMTFTIKWSAVRENPPS